MTNERLFPIFDTSKSNVLLLLINKIMFVKKISLLILSVIVAVIIGELILRAFNFSFSFYPTRVQFGWPNPVAIKKEVFNADSDLFWVPKNYNNKIHWAQKYRPSLIYMGCSVTEIGSFDTNLNELVIKNFPGSYIKYLNVGVSGWTSYQGLQQLKRDIVKIKPQIITIFFGWNDHWIGFGIEDKEISGIMSSFIFKFHDLRIIQLIQKFIVSIKIGNLKPERVSAKDFKINLVEMINIARKNQITPVLISAPTTHKKGREPIYLKTRWLRNLSDLVPLHQRYVSIVRDIAKENDVIICDLEEEFNKFPRKKLVSEFFLQDGIHLTGKGNQMIAKILFNCFNKNNLFSQKFVLSPIPKKDEK